MTMSTDAISPLQVSITNEREKEKKAQLIVGKGEKSDDIAIAPKIMHSIFPLAYFSLRGAGGNIQKICGGRK